jgi:hypothetical protein
VLEIELYGVFGYSLSLFYPKLSGFKIEERGIFAVGDQEEEYLIFELEPLHVDILEGAVANVLGAAGFLT